MDILKRKNNENVEIRQIHSCFDEVIANVKPPILIKKSLEFMSETFHLFGAYILVQSEDKSGFNFLEKSSSIEKMDKTKFIPIEDTEISNIIKQKNATYRPNIRVSYRVYKFDIKLINAGILSDFIIPFTIKKKIVGSINFCSTKEYGISDERRTALNSLVPRLLKMIQISL